MLYAIENKVIKGDFYRKGGMVDKMVLIKSLYKLTYMYQKDNGEKSHKYVDWNKYEVIKKKYDSIKNNPKISGIGVAKKDFYDVTNEFQ